MKQFYLLIILSIATFGFAFCQDLVLTDPTNKVAVLEEFTGTNCPACPTGHQAVKDLLAANPNAIAVAYSPDNSSLTPPYNGGNDIRRNFPAAFYVNPYYDNGGGRSMPSAFMNRMVNSTSNGRKISTGAFSLEADSVNSEASPINVGIESNYLPGAEQLNIEIEMYFTQNVTNSLGLYVLLTEDSVEANQSGSSITPYYHFHVFREAVSTDQWGDALTGTTNMGDYVSMTYNFDLSTTQDPMVLENADVLAFVYDKTSGEIVTGWHVHAKNGSTRHTGVGIYDVNTQLDVNMFPNPMSNQGTLAFNSESNESISFQIFDLLGQNVFSTEIVNVATGINNIDIDAAELNLASGNYLVRLIQNEKIGQVKFTVE